MATLHKWWQDPLAEDIHRHLREKELHLPVFQAQSPQIAYRRYLVDWLATVWERYNLCQPARHLAVALLDFFMDNLDIQTKHLHLVAIGCLLVSCKFEEQEVKIPRASDLNELVHSPGYTNLEYLQVELTILDFFKWRIGMVTAAHFTEYFMLFAISEDDVHGYQAVTDVEKILMYLKKYTNYFLEVCMQDHFYRNFKPSLVGAACIAAARICLHLGPTWTAELQRVSQYSLLELNMPIQALLKTHANDEMSCTRPQLVSQLTPPHSNPNSCAATPEPNNNAVHHFRAPDTPASPESPASPDGGAMAVSPTPTPQVVTVVKPVARVAEPAGCHPVWLQMARNQ